jgi:hypothetical protein
MLTPLARRVISRTRRLNRSRGFGAMTRLTSTSGKAESEKLPFLRPCYRTLCLMHLELAAPRKSALWKKTGA